MLRHSKKWPKTSNLFGRAYQIKGIFPNLVSLRLHVLICGCREQNPRCDARVGFALARCKHFIGKTHVVTLFFSSHRPLSSLDFRATRVSVRFFVHSLSNFEYDRFLV